MRGLTALGGKGIKAITLSLFALGIIYIVGTFFEKAAPYVKEVSETGFYPAHDHDESTPEPLLTPEVTTLSDEDHPSSGRWHSEAMAKIKDKVGSWLPMEKIYGAMLPPPWRDHSKSMEPPSYYHAPSSPKEERNVVVGKISILNNPENEYVDRAVRVHTVHDKRHGYQHYIMREQSSTSANENFAAQMLSVLKAELSKPSSERLEWLYYFPETTIILNPNVPLEIFLPPDHNSTLEPKHLLYSSPNSKAPSQDLAHTVFAAKVHDWTVDLFTTLLSRTRTTSSKQSHNRASPSSSPSSSSSSSSNDNDIAISSLLSLPAPLSPRAHALALPAHWLNAWPTTVPLTAPPSAPTLTHSDPADPDSSNTGDAERPHQVRRGSFVLDLPLPPSNLTTNEGSSSSSSSEDGGRWRDDDDDDDYKEKKKPDEREDKKSAVLARRFEHWLARAEARMPQWEAPLQDTWYADEARGFWEGGGEDAGKKESTPASPPSSPSPVAPPAGHADPGYTPAAGGSSKGVEKLKEEAMALVREMEASVHNWRQEVSEEVRRATESRCGRAREALAEVELDGSDEDEKVGKLQMVIGGLKKVSP